MAMIRLKNVGQSILFVDSLGLTLRPNEIRLFDEAKATTDGQLMQCVFSGRIQIATMTGEFGSVIVDDKESKIVIQPPPVRKPTPVQQDQEQMSSVDKNKPCDEAVLEARKQGQRNVTQEENEPKNTTPVVMFGNVPQRRSTTVNSDIPMPEYVNPDEVIGVENEDDPINGDKQAGDIIYADANDRIDVGREGLVDAREK